MASLEAENDEPVDAVDGRRLADVSDDVQNPLSLSHNLMKYTQEMEKLLIKMERSVVSEHETKLEAMRKHYESQIATQEQRIRELEKENVELQHTLRSKLTEGNPNIADLSDNNRPTKLAERCLELYDNQWTDAFETVQEYNRRKGGNLPEDDLEKEAISILLQVLKESWQFCKDEILEQDIHVKEAILRTQNSAYHLPDEFLRQLKSTKKVLAVHTAESVLKNFIARKRMVNNLRTSYIEPYVKECVTLCWLMANQDPPVVFELTAKPGDEFNTKKYREYMKRGSHIEFIIWPPMLLHEDGSVLVKGVAQGGKPSYVLETNATPSSLDMNKAVEDDTHSTSTTASRYNVGRGYTPKTVTSVLHDRRHQNPPQRFTVVQGIAYTSAGGHSLSQLPSDKEFCEYLDYLSRVRSSRLIRCLLGNDAYERCLNMHRNMNKDA